MKLGARDIDTFFKAPASRTQAALLYGPDCGLVRERGRTLTQTIMGATPDPLNRIELQGEQLKADPARLRDELSSLSLMGGTRLVIVQGATDKTASAIADAFEGLSPTAYLIVEAAELATSSPLRQLFEKDARFAALACYHDEGRTLEDTIRTALTAHNLRASRDAMQHLLTHLGNDRGVTLSEIDKIALYMGKEKEVTLEVAVALADLNSESTADDICHQVAVGNGAQAETLLTQLLREGTQPVVIVRALIRHFQRLDIALAHRETGRSVAEAIAQLRPPVFFKYVPAVTRALSRWQARTLASALNLLLRTEKELKSSVAPPALLLSHALQQTARLAG
jgi:DNA polymerase III subunit delta